MKYIDVEAILTPDEIESLKARLGELAADSDTVPTALIATLCSGRLPLELFALLKRAHAAILGEDLHNPDSTSPFKSMWQLFITNELSDKAVNLPLAIEPYARGIYSFSGKEAGRNTVYNSYYDITIDGTTVFPSEAEHPGLYRFIGSLRGIRNSAAHSTATISISRTRTAVMAGVLYLTTRFCRLLESHLLSPSDYVELTESILTEDPTLPAQASQYCRDNSRRRAAAKALLASRFSATPELAADENLVEALPNPVISPPLAPAGISVLCAPSGSGKTVFMARMAARCSIRQYVLYLPAGYSLAGESPLAQITNLFLGADKLPLLPKEHFARASWVNHALCSGNVALLMDSDEALGSNAEVAARLVQKYPTLMCVVAAEPGGEEHMPENATLCRVQPFDEANRRRMVRYITLLTHKGIDISAETGNMLATLAEDADISNPFVLTTLLHLLVSGNGNSNGNTPNFTALIAEFINALQSNPDIDPAEKQAILSNRMIAAYTAALSAARRTAADLASALNTAGAEAGIELLRSSKWLKNSAGRRKLFEICHMLRNEEPMRVLATMAATAMFDSRQSPNPLWPHPALNLLANETASVPYEGPGAANSLGVTYRPAPKYIAEQFTLNLLRIYRANGFNIDSNPQEVSRALRIAATLATDAVLDEIFRPYWAAQWLMVAGCKIPGTKIAGRAKKPEDNRKSLYVDILRDTDRPVAIALRLVQTAARMRLLKMAKYGISFVMGIVYHLIMRRMSDRQRLYFHRCLRRVDGEAALYPAEVAAICNHVLFYMDSPTSDIPGSDVRYNVEVPYKHIKDSNLDEWLERCRKHPQSRYMLLKVMAHAFASRHYADGAAIARTIIEMKAYKGTTAELFRETLSQIIDNHGIPVPLKNSLRLIPFDELDGDIAVQIYDPTVAEALVYYRDATEGGKVHIETLERPTSAMLPAVQLVAKDGINNYAYTVYSRPNPGEIILATQALVDVFPGTVLRFNGGDRWGLVQERLQSVADGDRKAYADLSLILTFPSPLPPAGTIEIEPHNTKNFRTRYVAAYTSAGGRGATVRIDDPKAIARLTALEEASLHTAIGNTGGRLTHVRIVPFAPVQTMLRVKLEGAAAATEYPATGTFTLHRHNNFDNAKNAHGLDIAVYDGSRQPQPTVKKGILFVAAIKNGKILVGSRIPLNAGTTLRDTADGTLLRVEKLYFMQKSAKIPTATLGAFRKATSKLKADEFKYVIEFACLYGNGDETDCQYRSGAFINSVFEFVWLQPVVVPEVADAPAVELKIGKITATRQFEDDGRVVLLLPKLAELKKAKRFSIEGIGIQYPFVTDDEGRLIPHDNLQPMLREMAGDDILLSFHRKDGQTLHFALPSPDSLFNLGRVYDYPTEFCDVLALYMNDNPELYHATFRLFMHHNRLDQWVRIGIRLGFIDRQNTPFSVGTVMDCGADGISVLDSRELNTPKPPKEPPLLTVPAESFPELEQGDIVAILSDENLLKLPGDLLELLRTLGLCGYRHGRVIHSDQGKIAIKWSNQFIIYTDIATDSVPQWREGCRVAYLPVYTPTNRQHGKQLYRIAATDIHLIS